MLPRSIRMPFVALVAFLSSLQLSTAQSSQSATTYVQSTNAQGETVYLADNRRPGLYTGNFGDCLGNSLISLTRFNAAYYADNMTVLFHFEGSTPLTNESLMSRNTARGQNPILANNPSQCISAFMLMVRVDST